MNILENIDRLIQEVKLNQTITFPKEEWKDIRRRLDSGKNVFSIRVSDEYDKYRQGEVYTTEWRAQIKIISIKKIKNIKEYEHQDELDINTIKQLKKYNKLDVLEFRKVNNNKI